MKSHRSFHAGHAGNPVTEETQKQAAAFPSLSALLEWAEALQPPSADKANPDAKQNFYSNCGWLWRAVHIFNNLDVAPPREIQEEQKTGADDRDPRENAPTESPYQR